MNFLVSLLAFWVLTFSASSGITPTYSESVEQTSKTELDTIHILIEKHYSLHTEYPTEKELIYEYETALPGIDPEALLDDHGRLINSVNSNYHYTPQNCTALGCKHYSLKADLDNGKTYEIQSTR